MAKPNDMKYAITAICVLVAYTIISTLIHINGKLRIYKNDQQIKNGLEKRFDINDKEWNEFKNGDTETMKKIMNKWKNKSE